MAVVPDMEHRQWSANVNPYKTRSFSRRLGGVALVAIAACGVGNWPQTAGGAEVAPLEPPSDSREDRVDLRPRFTPGQTTRYEMQINTQSQLKSAELPELDQKQAMKQTLRLSLRVLEAGSDGATLELVYDSARMVFESDDITAEYDSTRPPVAKPGSTGAAPKDPLADADPSKLLETLVKGMVGSKLTLKTDAAGNIVSVSGDGGVSGMTKSFMNSVGGGLPGLGGGLPTSGQTAQWIITGSRPSGLVRVGETWTNEDGLAGTPLGEFKMKTSHTLVSHRGGSANVKFSGRAEAPSATSTSPTGFQLQHLNHDGTYEWDTRRGGLAAMNADLRVAIEANLTGSAMSHESATTVSVKRLDR